MAGHKCSSGYIKGGKRLLPDSLVFNHRKNNNKDKGVEESTADRTHKHRISPFEV